MDHFWASVDPYLAGRIREIIPLEQLIPVIEQEQDLATPEAKLIAIEPLLLRVIEEKNALGAEDNDTMAITELLGLLQSDTNQHERAAATYRGLVEVDGRNAPRPGRNLAAMFNLALELNKLGQYAQAESYLNDLLPLLEANLGRSSEQYVGGLGQLMEAVGNQGRMQQMDTIFAEHAALVGQYNEPEKTVHSESARHIRDAVKEKNTST